MGKKGKRSKQKDAKKEADKFIKESNKLMDGAFNDLGDGLYSKAVKQMREAIRLLESKKELMVYTRDKHLGVSSSLMGLEYRRRNYKAALGCCNYYMANSRSALQINDAFVSIFYQLIMLRLNGKECQLSKFIHYISQEDNIITEITHIEAVFTFRVHKRYDSAIQIEKTCGPLKLSPFESKISLALTYLEQYRIDFHKRSHMREKDFTTMDSLITSLQTEFPLQNFYCFEYCMVLAQWHYLTHALTCNRKFKEGLIITAHMMVESCLQESSSMLPYSHLSEDKCYSCGQTATSTEVLYVCSGCRVACYCCIDHQRMTWKKEAIKGMRIGHEILCPLYKANRKYTHAKDLKDEEKETRMKRRFERECVKFLEYGLGLKDKCFPCDYQSMSVSWI